MKFFKKLKRNIKTIKIVLIILTVLASIAAIVAGIFFWKKKKEAEKLDSESIDNLIDEQLDAVDVNFEGAAIED